MLVKDVKKLIRKCTGREACYFALKGQSHRIKRGIEGIISCPINTILLNGGAPITVLELRSLLKTAHRDSMVICGHSWQIISIGIVKDTSVIFYYDLTIL